jgi:hypothetical protein
VLTGSIQFRSQGETLPEDGPNGTLCRPDLIAYDSSLFVVQPENQPTSARTRSKAKDKSSFIDEENLAWMQLEATAEFHSTGTSKAESLLQAVTYTAYHLLTRPDRVVVPGLHLSSSDFHLILTGPSGTCHTKLQWPDSLHIELLRDFIYRIINPSSNMIDPTTTRNHDGTFTLKLHGKDYPGCRLKWLGQPIGRRTTIFDTKDQDVPIIKDQYLSELSVEAGLLKQIHENHPIPGVVQVLDQADESKITCSIGKQRQKVRLGLKDVGIPFIDIQTPYGVLVVIYDLLEGKCSSIYDTLF